MAGLLPPVGDVGVLRAPVRSFVALCALFALLLVGLGLFERLGLYSDRLPEAVLLGALATSALVALAAHGRRPADFYLAGRSVGPLLGGSSGAGGLAGLLAVGLAGSMFGTAPEMFIAAAGLLLGSVLLVFVAPLLNRSGGTHFGDVLAARFGASARTAGAVVAVASSLLVLVAVLKTAAPLVAALVGVTPQHGLYLVAAIAAAAVLPGGMRSLTWTQAGQYLLAVLACLVPVVLLVAGEAGEGSGGVFGGRDPQAVLTELARPVASADVLGWFAPMLLLAAGTASLPQVLALSFVAPSPRAAGLSMLFSGLLFGALVGLGLLLGQGLLAVAPTPAPADAAGDVLGRAMPLLVALPPLVVGLIMAGLLAALLAAGQAALFSAAAGLARELWDEVLDRRGPAGRRILAARLLIVGAAYGAGWLAGRWPVDAAELFRWALALATAGNLPPLLLAIFWRRCTPIAAAMGIASGFTIAALAFLLAAGPPAVWPDASPVVAAGLAVAAALLVSVAVSLFGPARQRDVAAESAVLRRGSGPLGERPA